jgi:hypothetical protein
MKLYATTTSERATKGQGGNKYLDIIINLYNDDRYSIKVDKDKLLFLERGYSEPLLTRYHKDIIKQEEQRLDYIKGKKQKGECNHYIIRDDYGKEYCQECGKYSFN